VAINQRSQDSVILVITGAADMPSQEGASHSALYDKLTSLLFGFFADLQGI